jgi:uracil-DNA glycosylase
VLFLGKGDQMDRFKKEIEGFQNQINQWQKKYPQWGESIVFNEDLLKLNPSEVRFILVGDNPGKEEQKAKRYLIGTAGQGARRFFEETAHLVDSFDRQVMVLNKTPFFTPSTMDLGELSEVEALLEESQKYMAQLMVRFQQILGCPLWVTGFGGCRNAKGDWNFKTAKSRPLAPFFKALREEIEKSKVADDKLGFFKHFSYAHFQKDIHRNGIPTDYLQSLSEIGSDYKINFSDAK